MKIISLQYCLSIIEEKCQTHNPITSEKPFQPTPQPGFWMVFVPVPLVLTSPKVENEAWTLKSTDIIVIFLSQEMVYQQRTLSQEMVNQQRTLSQEMVYQQRTLSQEMVYQQRTLSQEMVSQQQTQYPNEAVGREIYNRSTNSNIDELLSKKW